MSALGTLPIVILGLGLFGGLLTALFLARGNGRSGAADLELKIADLESERDQLFATLRTAESEDRTALEHTAAVTLRDLERYRRELDALGVKRSPKTDAKRGGKKHSEIDSRPAAASFTQRHPLFAGALLGGGMVGLVAVLVIWAIRDTQPTPDQTPVTTSSGGPDPGFDRGEPGLPPQVAAQVTAFEARIAAEPENVGLRKELAQLLLAHGQFFDAFQQAHLIAAVAPGDPDASYIEGIVRYAMGQPEMALELLSNALVADPTYAQAAVMKGILELQMGDQETAISTWEAGLAAVDDQHPGLEHLVAQARAGRTAEEILSAPPP